MFSIGIDISFVQALWLPPYLLFISSVVLRLFELFLGVLADGAKGKLKLPLMKTIKPALRYLNTGAEALFGKATSFKYTFTHVVFLAGVLMLIAIYNTLLKANALKQKQLDLQKKNK